MDKVLLINKEKGYTSRDVVNVISKTFGERKVGHFGTLDPMATGLLVIGLGACTKIGNLFTDETKEYVVTVLVGKSTDTYDVTGNVLFTSDERLEEDKLVSCLNNFIGTYEQEVPIYSAVKVNGKKLYEYARSGLEVSLPKKEVTIFSIEYLGMNFDDSDTYFSFKCLVSKGTYIRSLINDISVSLGIPMCMSALERTKCGDFSLDDAYTLSDISDGNFSFLSISDVLDVDVMEVPDSIKKLVLNGSCIDRISDKYILFTLDGENISLYGVYNSVMKPYLTFKK